MGSVGIGMVYGPLPELEIQSERKLNLPRFHGSECEKPYLRLPKRSNSKKRLQMMVEESV
jgi:hypothetical protein